MRIMQASLYKNMNLSYSLLDWPKERIDEAFQIVKHLSLGMEKRLRSG